MKVHGWLLINVAALTVLAACGSDSTKSSNAENATVVGVEGGELKQGAITLAIPQGALSTGVAITIAETSAITVPSGLTQVGPAYDFGPDGTVFDKPVIVTLELGALSGMGDVALYDSSDGSAWTPSEGSLWSSPQLTASIHHFSFVAPFAAADSAAGGAAGTGGVTGNGGAAQGGSTAGGSEAGGSAGTGTDGQAGAATDGVCLPIGTACGGSTAVCCTNSCVNGMCSSGTLCQPAGASCSASADCCTGLCSGGMCAAPQGA